MSTHSSPTLNPNIAVLHLAWRQYRTRTRTTDRSRFDVGVAVTPVWRDHALMLESAWEGLVKACLPPALHHLPAKLLEARWRLRHAWMRPGGKLFTKRGTRRRRNGHNVTDSVTIRDIRKYTREIGWLRDDLREELPPDAGMVLLACSGVLYTANGRPRRDKRVLEWVEMARPRWFWRIKSLERVGVLQRLSR